jgi:hypothetical protein
VSSKDGWLAGPTEHLLKRSVGVATGVSSVVKGSVAGRNHVNHAASRPERKNFGFIRSNLYFPAAAAL